MRSTLLLGLVPLLGGAIARNDCSSEDKWHHYSVWDAQALLDAHVADPAGKHTLVGGGTYQRTVGSAKVR